MSDYHTPVLLNECIEGLNIKKMGVYVDVTFGGGGHSKAIYDKMNFGKLIAFDQDQEANANTKIFINDEDKQFMMINANFKYLKKFLKYNQIDKVDGILADLGVSSHQIDDATRGFSTRFDADLDMRMNDSIEVDAKYILNNYSEKQMVEMFSRYGEIKNAKTLARHIIKYRIQKKIENTLELKNIASEVFIKTGNIHKYLAQVFQAIRIEVNDEIEALKELLIQSSDCLNEGGRMVVISYHSLEDRLVKNYYKTGDFEGVTKKDFYGNNLRPFEPLNSKPIEASLEELNKNPRARSAKLRIAIKN